MRITPLLLTLALASAASAQAEWEFRLSSDVISPQEPSITVTLAAGFPATDFAFAGARWDVHASEAGWSGWERTVLPGSGPCDCSGRLSGSDILGILRGQIYDFGLVPDPSNPIELWRATFTVTDFSTARHIELSTTTDRFEVFSEDLGPGMSPVESRAVNEGYAVIRVIPAPAPLALLALAGLATTRRCRTP